VKGGAPILTADQMRAAEQAAFDGGVDPYDLMERAGAGAAEIIWRAGFRRDMLILCGPGNNGGDGFVIARLLRERGVPVRVAAFGESRTVSSQRARAAWDGPVESLLEAEPATQLVDAVFGIGLRRGLDDAMAAVLCQLVSQASYSYALDLPSGVRTDDGALLSDVPRFGLTLAMGALKPAHLLQPAADHVGQVHLVDLGIALPSDAHSLTPPRLHRPGPEAHKYSRGMVAVVGGGMPGASLLASAAAAYSGAGTVRRFALDEPVADIHAIIAHHTDSPAGIAEGLADDRTSVVLVGPGLGRDADAQARLDAALAAKRPMVLDADALTLLGERDSLPPLGQAILTPHEGEFVRLFGKLDGSKIDRARQAARMSGAVTVYKGPDSVIAAPDGRVVVAGQASAWLSTAGTGDVLAGVIAGRFAVTGDPFRAACEGVWLHGEAARRSGAAFVADDLIDALPAAIAARL